MHHEYPKYVNGIIAQTKEQEDALLAGTAKVEETKSAQGSTFEVTDSPAAVPVVDLPPVPPIDPAVEPPPAPPKKKKSKKKAGK